jgi:hypothetical protein
MAVTKISQFPEVTQANSTSVLPIVQDGVTSRILSTDLVPTLYVDTEITSAQILDSINTSIEIIAQPSNGDRFFIDKMVIKYSYGTTPYTNTSGSSAYLQPQYFVSGVGTSASNTFFISGSSSFLTILSGFTTVNVPDSPASIKLTPPTTLINGDGTLKVRTYYKVIPSTF